jgi:hypothetical protein
MTRSFWLVAGLLGLALVAHPAQAETRNPFGVRDVPNALGEDVKRFAEGRQLPGGKDDRNAAQWVARQTRGNASTLDGEWSGRWEEGVGTAAVKAVGDRVYVLYTDREGRLSGSTWLLEAVRQGQRLVGRWVQVGNPNDTGAYLGLIVDGERIDGAWGSSDRAPAKQEMFAPNTRWDFRRNLKK